MRRVLRVLIGLALITAVAGWALTRPDPLEPSAVAGLTGDPAPGALIFAAAGCASCHAAPGAKDAAKLVLSGGQRFETPFGAFLAPNISPDSQNGIGGWTQAQFASAVTRGVSPDGAHYYPAFPYGSYARMTLQDVAHLKAYMDTLPASNAPNQPHDLGFPFNIRASLGGWKLLNLASGWQLANAPTDTLKRGRYLVEALGHCAECHTPRDALGGLDRAKWMHGAPNPSGKGRIPGITPSQLDWAATDIAYYLETGFTPEFDSAGGSMAKVVENTAQLPASDRAAIAAYLKALP